MYNVFPVGYIAGNPSVTYLPGDNGVSTSFFLHLLEQCLILNSSPIRYLEVSVVIEVAYRLSRDKPERKYSPNPPPKQECGLARPSQPRIPLVLKARPLISSATYSQSSSRQSAGAIQALNFTYCTPDMTAQPSIMTESSHAWPEAAVVTQPP